MLHLAGQPDPEVCANMKRSRQDVGAQPISGVPKIPCDAVMGRVGKPWHVCARKAIVRSNRTVFVPGHGALPFKLHYCRKHLARAYRVELQCLRIVSVENL